MRLKAKNSAIRELIAPISANKITGTTIDVKMGVIKINSVTFFHGGRNGTMYVERSLFIKFLLRSYGNLKLRWSLSAKNAENGLVIYKRYTVGETDRISQK